MYVITAHQRHGQTDRQTDGRTSSDPMTATLLKHVAVKNKLRSKHNSKFTAILLPFTSQMRRKRERQHNVESI